MKIGLIGYGKMGKEIEKLALEQGHSIVGKIHSSSYDYAHLQRADVCMEFTAADAFLTHFPLLAKQNRHFVIGTTGWDEHHDTIERVVHETGVGVVISPNFSIGVNLFISMLSQATRLISPFKEYDIGAFEMHHKLKKDAPSGTSLLISKAIKESGKHVSFTSLRCGSIPGVHTVYFDSPDDTITLEHTARSRSSFAKGALLAAEWIRGKQGLFTFETCLQDYFPI